MSVEKPSHLTQEVFDQVVVTKPVDYADRYQEFLTTTDEKRVISDSVASLLLPGTVLDVGAGTGEIPDIVGVDPHAYTAIEQRPEFIDILKTKGYTVVESLFPCALPSQYTNVLMSHVLYGRDQCQVMIPAAWDHVEDAGQLLAVTYRDRMDDYNTLLHRVGHNRRRGLDTRFSYLENTFESLGELSIHQITSHILSENPEGIAASVSFMATNTKVGTPERRAEIFDAIMSEQPYLDDRYQQDDGSYVFPIEHFVLQTRKV